MITTFAPVKFSPSPPALVDTKHREMLGSRLNSLTRRVLSAALVDPSKRLYTIPLLITNSSKMSRSWKETDIVLNDSVSCDKLILKSMVRNLAKCKSTKFFSISKTNIWQRIESLRNLCPQGFSGLPWTGRWGIFGILYETVNMAYNFPSLLVFAIGLCAWSSSKKLTKQRRAS